MNLYRYGDKVNVEGIPATVLAADLSGPGYSLVKYQVAWANDKTMSTAWVDAALVQAEDESATRAVILYDGVKA